ncbi:histone deacetylase family protein [Polycladidibacter stylochi]|uniref:histone deacetylase family protein n=1 Tax=Polycladidibacter stylochi TaxID=1807766 RepID=UPI00083407C1|nr:histone deacetylase family protein [Pseudovibrio stylochi]
MSTLLLHHSSYLSHLTPIGHPERPDRLRAIDRILENERFLILERDTAPIGRFQDVARAHRADYINGIHRKMPRDGIIQLDQDTTLSPGSWEAAMRAVGGACKAVEEVMEGKVTNAFSLSRPPGHHAESQRSMGFCVFNNAAIAARFAQDHYGAERVVIVDIDVHHGNGTQEIFWADKTVMYASIHQGQLYPGTGEKNEEGEFGTIVNAPLVAGDGGDTFKEAFLQKLLPRINNFAPDLVIISAGFDAHQRDPMGSLRLSEIDFAWVTRQLMEVADKHSNLKLVSLLEGGYDLEGLARSCAAHVMTLMDH